VAQNLSLTNNEMPLGTLDLAGTPAPSWQESAQPLQVESSVLELFFGALRSAEQRQAGWWNQLAPDVPYSAATPLYGASIVGSDGQVFPTITLRGERVTGAILKAEPVINGGDAPGRYQVTMSATVRGGALLITSWQMERIS
jgi:hypothetical protein